MGSGIWRVINLDYVKKKSALMCLKMCRIRIVIFKIRLWQVSIFAGRLWIFWVRSCDLWYICFFFFSILQTLSDPVLRSPNLSWKRSLQIFFLMGHRNQPIGKLFLITSHHLELVFNYMTKFQSIQKKNMIKPIV